MTQKVNIYNTYHVDIQILLQDSNGVGDDEMLLHLNLVHDGTQQFKDYEQDAYRYFLSSNANEESKETDDEEVKSEM